MGKKKKIPAGWPLRICYKLQAFPACAMCMLLLAPTRLALAQDISFMQIIQEESAGGEYAKR